MRVTVSAAVVTMVAVSIGTARAAEKADSSLLPLLAGWKPDGDVGRYDSAGLWEVINGGAQLYIDYGVKELQTREFKRGTQTIGLYVFDMGTTLGAFGIFAKERPSTASPVKAGGASAVAEPYQCLMLQGRYYVKATAYSGKVNNKLCQTVLSAAARELPQDEVLPKELASLPTEGQVPGSLRFTRMAFLGLSELEDCIHAQYGTDKGGKYQVFRIAPLQGRTAGQVWERLAKKWQTVPTGRLPTLMRTVPYTGNVTVMRTSDAIVGVAGLPDLATARQVLEGLVKS